MGSVVVDGTFAPSRRAPAARSDAAVSSARPTLAYRPALDGLRAIAVLAVMVEHSGVRRPGSTELLLPGGFLGVDVFFVISGFLITSLLLIEHSGTGRVDLGQFWLRRARRLLPAACVAIAATCVAASVVDLAIDGRSLRGDALAALAYVANWRFILTDQSYFAAFGVPSPFRHLWSLSLEEQWYLVFPLLLVGLLALVRRRTWALAGVLVAAALASAVWMAVCFTPGQDPSRAYYGTDTRAHTLLVGALLAVAMVRWPVFARRLARLTPWLGLAGFAALAVLFAMVSGTNEALYQGGFLIVAVASAAAVAGVALPDAAGPVHWALGHRPLVAIGTISYGLYLWHWPIFVIMTPDRVGLTGAELAAARIAVAFVVAVVSYVFVEQPIRRHGLRGVTAPLGRVGIRLRPALVASVLVLAAVAVVGVSTRSVSSDVTLDVTAATSPTIGEVVTTTVVAPDHVLPGIPVEQPIRLMVGGDSVAWSVGYPWLADLHPLPAGISEHHLVAALGCTITPGVSMIDGIERHQEGCRDWRGSWEATAFERQPDLLLAMWGAWEVHDHRDGDRLLVAGTPEFGAAYQQAMDDSIDLVTSVSPDTRIVYATVTCMVESHWAVGGTASPRNDPANLAWVNAHTEQVAARHAGRVLVVDLDPLLCPDGVALDEIDGVVPRNDGVHFSKEFAPTVWAYIEAEVRPWMATPAPLYGD